ncbi:MAG: hypothetical protein LQ337_007595 [Flavoplaca oasis]|nr:MAG: hypothetical protein LQ337_007595 [Flavoplaca oasis]
MSASARLVRHGSTNQVIRTLHQNSAASPSSTQSAFLRSPLRPLPPHQQILAVLHRRRLYSTDTSTHGSNAGGFPPPGFNAEEAKKPLPPDDTKRMPDAKPSSETASSVSAQTTKAASQEAVTDVPKTKATEQQSLTELATDKANATKLDEKIAAESKKEQKKLTIMQKVRKEIQHYWDGTKLLATEVKISTKLALRMAAGYELSRRENRQLQRTVQDLARLVPFSAFVIVPFAELLLPVALKLFPNLLPSTYEGQKSKDAKATSLRTTRKEVSSFLRDTLKETGLPVSAVNAQKEEFAEFFRKVRATGQSPTQEDVIKVCKIFKDDLTLDNLSRPQLVAMARYMNLNAFGTDMLLRYQIRRRMRQIKLDDRAIWYEGVDSLSVPELQNACASRGLRTQGMSPGRLRDDLQMWLDLRLKYGLPSTLLVLSNAFMYTQGKDSEISSQIDALQSVLSSIPEELFHEIELEVHNAEGAATNKQRLEVLKEQQELIEEENEQNEENGNTGQAAPKDDENIDEEDQKKATAAKEAQQQSEAAEAEKDVGEAVEHEQKETETEKDGTGEDSSKR